MSLHYPGNLGDGMGVLARMRAALRRDWEQTKYDLWSSAGKQLNQHLTDTVAQFVGAAPIPPADRPVPRRLCARWVVRD